MFLLVIITLMAMTLLVIYFRKEKCQNIKRGTVLVSHAHTVPDSTIFEKWGAVKVKYSAPLYRHRGSVQAVRPIGGVEV